MRQLAISFTPDASFGSEESFEFVRIADEAGAHSVWVPETWGLDCFTVLSLLAQRTTNIRLGTAIVNVFSRSPATLAQHFASLDLISGGRALAGLGASGPFVVEHLHGVPFERPVGRLRTTIQVLRMLTAGESVFMTGGRVRAINIGFTLDMPVARPKFPILIASLHPASLDLAAQVSDGVLPIFTPLGCVPDYLAALFARAKAAGRTASEFMVRSPGRVTVTDDDPEAAVFLGARSAAYRIAVMGDSLYNHWCRMGYQELADLVRVRWNAEGWQEAVQAIPRKIRWELNFAGSAGACAERLAEQEELGINVHLVAMEHADRERAIAAFARLGQ